MYRGSIFLLLAVTVIISSIFIACSQATAEWHIDRANELCNQGRYDEAIEECTKAIQLDPTFTTAYNFRGDTYFYLGQYEYAIKDYSKVIELDPDFTD